MTETQRERTEIMTLHKILFTIFALFIVSKYYMRTTPILVKIPEPQFSLLGPYNTTEVIVEDNYEQLIDINNFTFIHNPQPCKNYTAGLLLMVIVSSNPNHAEKRQIIRSTWGRNFDSTKVVFLIGETKNNTKVSKLVREEITKHGDIVYGNFKDAYRNLTYKHVMGLKWVTHHCPVAKYVLKTDDDVLVNSRELRHFLARELSPWGARDLIMCQVLKNAKAQRSEKSKWKVTTQEYSKKFYPTYCAGWAILYSQDVIQRLLMAAQSIPYFWIDDVHITGICAEMIGVPRTVLSSLILSQTRLKMVKLLGPQSTEPFIFGPPDLTSVGVKELWRAIPE